jgi:zinc/manganese transport system substrate-binding protein
MGAIGRVGGGSAMRSRIAAGLVALGVTVSAALAAPIEVVAAENVYGDIAAQIGGDGVAVKSILTNPTQDPHAFEASAATARAIADARLVVYNGADFDPWAARLLAASKSRSRAVIEVAKLVHKKAGGNPHLWYDPNAISRLAAALATELTRLDPVRADDYARRHAAFEASMSRLRDRVAALREKYAGTAITATEPLFDYMADALGLRMRNGRFQLAVMNGTEPSAAAIVAFENDLRTGVVKALIYNAQTSQALAERMRALAIEVGVPVVAITETEPPGQRYQAWMGAQLDSLERALGSPTK